MGEMESLTPAFIKTLVPESVFQPSVSVKSTDDLSVAWPIFCATRFRALPVVENSKIVGVVTLDDCLLLLNRLLALYPHEEIKKHFFHTVISSFMQGSHDFIVDVSKATVLDMIQKFSSGLRLLVDPTKGLCVGPSVFFRWLLTEFKQLKTLLQGKKIKDCSFRKAVGAVLTETKLESAFRLLGSYKIHSLGVIYRKKIVNKTKPTPAHYFSVPFHPTFNIVASPTKTDLRFEDSLISVFSSSDLIHFKFENFDCTISEFLASFGKNVRDTPVRYITPDDDLFDSLLTLDASGHHRLFIVNKKVLSQPDELEICHVSFYGVLSFTDVYRFLLSLAY